MLWADHHLFWVFAQPCSPPGKGAVGDDEVLALPHEPEVSAELNARFRMWHPGNRLLQLQVFFTPFHVIRKPKNTNIFVQLSDKINGLAVISAGPLSYGFPARITSTIGPGRAGIIDIEGAASLSGSIHTKGFQILGGLLRHLLQTDHPLAFSASIAFEQSYGGIDGDSASGAEICCLLSALTKIPLRQSLAMTGAIDQHGHLQAIGGVNEKIEGFFDACKSMGLNGDQGVIIPLSNAGDLMLRQDVVEACRKGEFSVYAVRRVVDALEVLTGMEAGEADENGAWPEDSVLGIAQRQASEFWYKSHGTPSSRNDTHSDD